MALTSAQGVLALLEEPGDSARTTQLKVSALKTLNQIVDQHWPEIANSIPTIEMLYEDESFRDRGIAAALVSKVYYHLEQFEESVTYALGAGESFDVSQKSEYVETLVAQCVDRYIRLQSEKHEGKIDIDIDPRLLSIVDRMFRRCYDDREYKQALGIALEARRIDKVRESITIGPDQAEMLAYCFSLCQKHVGHRGFRMKVLRELVDIYSTMEVPDFINISQCLYFLDDAEAVAAILEKLIQEGVDPSVTAFQIAFDLCENQNQPFLLRTLKALTIGAEKPSDTPQADSADMDTSETLDESGENASAETASTPSETPASPPTPSEPVDLAVLNRASLLRKILSGERSLDLHLQFLYSHNHADSYIMNNIMDKLDNRNSLTHNATVISHAIFQCGTTQDQFLRNHLDWLSRASNWAKFTASASFGVVHKGHIRESMKLLGSYLPKPGQQGSPYQEGGALYAMGLIHSCHGDEKIDYVMEALRKSSHNEIVQHGACLGLGLVAMSTQRSDVYQLLKDTLFHDNAVSGEAAGLAMGLTLLGSANGAAIKDMIDYAHETKHEKIIRGLAMGLALTVVAREEEADGLIEQLCLDKDPILRYGGCFAIALAYVATGHNRSVQKLLHIGVSDVSDDVRRAAVMSLGFVLCATPKQVPEIVKLLAESFNAHARYGAAMAVGISCAATGLPSAIELLEPLLKDRVDFVRQAAMMSLAMVLLQQNKTQTPKVEEALDHFTKLIEPKNPDQVGKMGAIIASGLMFCGGNNCTISMISEDGHKRIASIVGLAVSLQHWYWYPLFHFLSLSITPTAVIGLNNELQMPRYFRLKSNAPPALYDYPPYIKTKVADKKKKSAAVELSITAKAKARRERKRRERGEDVMEDEEKEKPSEDGDETMSDASKDKKEDSSKDKDSDKDSSKTESSDQKTEAQGTEDSPEAKWVAALTEKAENSSSHAILSNPCRVTPRQQAVVELIPNQRYVPVKPKLSGIMVLRDTRPAEEVNLIIPKRIEGVDVDDEPSPPKPFEFTRE